MLAGKLRKSLLEIGDITLDVCLQKAHEKEIAQAQARSMQPLEAPAASSSSLHRIHQTQKGVAGRGGRLSETAQSQAPLPCAAPQDRLQGGGKCYACRRPGHFAGKGPVTLRQNHAILCRD